MEFRARVRCLHREKSFSHFFAGHPTPGGDMKKNLVALAVPLFFSIGMAAGPIHADDGHRSRLFIDRDVDTFAVLPNGVRFPEGITANPANGDIYTATFDAPGPGNPTPKNKLLRFDRQ